MLVTDAGDEICFVTSFPHPLSFNITYYISHVHQHSEDVTNNETLSPTLKNCHQRLCSLILLLTETKYNDKDINIE